MFRLRLCVLIALSFVIAVGQARADFLIFDLAQRDDWFAQTGLNKELELKDVDSVFVLPGQAVVAPGTFIVYRKEPGATQVHFRLEDVKLIRAPTTRGEFNKRLSLAGKEPDSILQAGIWGLKRGSFIDFYKAVDKVRTIDPAHATAARLAGLAKELKQALPDDPESERKLRALVNRDGMRIDKSNHFQLLTDTEAEPLKGRSKTRANERLLLLEKSYETFLLLFHAQNVQIEVPKERLSVVLFKNRADFQEAAKRIRPTLAGALVAGERGIEDLGVWDSGNNVCYFHDGAGSRFDLLARLIDKIKDIGKNDAKKARDPESIRAVKTLMFLSETEHDWCDAAAVSNVCSRQMAASTGLVPRASTPRWVREGLAIYFEEPACQASAGIGGVTQQRLNSYRELAWKDLSRSNLDFIISDKIFVSVQKAEDQLAAAGQAWGLTHFLMENHFAEFVSFCRLLAERQKETAPFTKAFSVDRKALDLEWHKYMDSLKTELEVYQLESEKELLKQRLENKR